MCKNLKYFCPRHTDYYAEATVDCDEYTNTRSCISTRTNNIVSKKKNRICDDCYEELNSRGRAASLDRVAPASPAPDTVTDKTNIKNKSKNKDASVIGNEYYTVKARRNVSASSNETGVARRAADSGYRRFAIMDASEYKSMPIVARAMMNMMGISVPHKKSGGYAIAVRRR